MTSSAAVTAQELDAQILSAEHRRRELKKEWLALAVATMNGDEDAKHRTDALDHQIQQINGEITRAQFSRTMAAHGLSANVGGQ